MTGTAYTKRKDMNSNTRNNMSGFPGDFGNIGFKDIEKANFLRRIDTKYVFDLNYLPSVLDNLSSDYLLVDFNGVTSQFYQTSYFDTKDYWFYTQHHNGIKNRYKVRFRTYMDSNISFLEVKHKTNRKETIKSRLKQQKATFDLGAEQNQFINSKLDFVPKELYPSLENSFHRITLVSKNLDERITIDTNLIVKDTRNQLEQKFSKLCIIETKRDFHLKNTVSSKSFLAHRIKSSGFSKYCMGLALVNPAIKKNLFKPRLIGFKSILN